MCCCDSCSPLLYLIRIISQIDRNVHVLTCGVTVPVTFIVHPGMQGIGNILALIDMAKKSNRVEYVYAILKIYGTNDDQVISKHLLRTSSDFSVR